MTDNNINANLKVVVTLFHIHQLARSVEFSITISQSVKFIIWFNNHSFFGQIGANMPHKLGVSKTSLCRIDGVVGLKLMDLMHYACSTDF